MGVDGGEPWIRTERTHPLVFVVAFGGILIAEVIWVSVGFTIFVSEYGIQDTELLEVGGAALFAIISVVNWTIFHPAAVRISPDGIEVRRPFGSVFKIPAQGVTLLPRPPVGFGLLRYPTGGIILSPNQFAAAKRFFPMEAANSRPAAPPLP
jgi:hypothetical protein